MSIQTAPAVETPEQSTDSALSNANQSPTRQKNTARIEFIDFARGICALWVVTAHVLSGQYLQGAIPIDQVVPQILVSNAHQAVTTFICLSGFSLFVPIARNGGKMRESLWQYLASRAWRILPPYYCALAIGAWITYKYDLLPHHLFVHELRDHILLIHDFTDRSLLIGPLWSIAVEWHIYFLLPIFVLAFQKFGIVRTLLGTTIAAFAANAYLNNASTYWYYYALFAFGGAAALIAYSETPAAVRFKSLPWAKLSLIGFAVFVLNIVIMQVDFEWGLAVCAGLVAAAQYNKPVIYPRVLVRAGAWSYSLYLIHFPIILVVLHYTGQNYKELVFGLPACLVGGYVFYLLVERPTLIIRKNLMRKHASPAVV